MGSVDQGISRWKTRQFQVWFHQEKSGKSVVDQPVSSASRIFQIHAVQHCKGNIWLNSSNTLFCFTLIWVSIDPIRVFTMFIFLRGNTPFLWLSRNFYGLLKNFIFPRWGPSFSNWEIQFISSKIRKSQLKSRGENVSWILSPGSRKNWQEKFSRFN